MKVRLAVAVDLPASHESTRSLSRSFNAINAHIGGVAVQCSNCRDRGKVNSKLMRRGEKFVCGKCRG